MQKPLAVHVANQSNSAPIHLFFQLTTPLYVVLPPNTWSFLPSFLPPFFCFPFTTNCACAIAAPLHCLKLKFLSVRAVELVFSFHVNGWMPTKFPILFFGIIGKLIGQTYIDFFWVKCLNYSCKVTKHGCFGFEDLACLSLYSHLSCSLHTFFSSTPLFLKQRKETLLEPFIKRTVPCIFLFIRRISCSPFKWQYKYICT